MNRSELERIVRFWYEARNCGKIAKVGPPDPRKNGQHEEQPVQSTWEHDRVNATLGAMGRGIYAPVTLMELLDHVYGRQEPLESFHLLPPGAGLPAYVLGLGFRSERLVKLALKDFFRALAKAVEEVPKPEGVREFETA